MTSEFRFQGLSGIDLFENNYDNLRLSNLYAIRKSSHIETFQGVTDDVTILMKGKLTFFGFGF
jgi:hypothetical protein